MATSRSLVSPKTFTKGEQPVAKTKMLASEWVRKGFAEHGDGLLKEMVAEFAQLLMSADVDGVCVSGYGIRTPDGSTAVTAIAPGTGTRGLGQSS